MPMGSAGYEREGGMGKDIRLKPEHEKILRLYIAGQTEAAIAKAVGYTIDGVDSVIDRTFQEFFPELQGLSGTAFRHALIRAGTSYLEEVEESHQLLKQGW